MIHLRGVTRSGTVVAKAESLLVKQAQLEVLGQAVAIAGDIAALVKGEGGEDE